MEHRHKPLLISHRGNLNGRQPGLENWPGYIDDAITAGYNVEIDLWFSNGGGIYLGHDAPQYKIDDDFLIQRSSWLWVHTKNILALRYCLNNQDLNKGANARFRAGDIFFSIPLRYFFHEKEKHTLIANTKLIWSHNIETADGQSIIPLLTKQEALKYDTVAPIPFGICSDYVALLKQEFEKPQ